MNGKNEKRDSETSFDGLVDLGSVPPPAGVVGPDVHAARTAIAAMPSSLLEELRRARANETGEAKRTRKQEKFDLPPSALLRRSAPSFSSFANEAPTAPGKEGPRLLRPLAPDVTDVPPATPTENLIAVIEAALVEPPPALSPPPSPPLSRPPSPVPPPRVERVPTPPMPMPTPMPMQAAPMPTPLPVPMSLPPADDEGPSVRMPFLLAFLFVTSVGLILTAIAIAERIHR